MSFYVSFKSMLQDFGTDLTVYPATSSTDKKRYHYVAGEKVEDETEKAQPIQLHEPVVPFNSQTAFLTQFISGGAVVQADLLWVSNHLYPKNTIVEVPSQPGQKYRVINFSNYQAYSDVVIYELKGDDQHPNGQ